MAGSKHIDVWMTVSGVLLFILGIVCCVWPGITTAVIAVMMGIGFIVAGIFDVVDWFSNHEAFGYNGWIMFVGIVDIVFGIFILVFLGASSVALDWMVAVGVVIMGCSFINGASFFGAVGARNWWVPMLSGVLTVILGILMFSYWKSLGILIGIVAIARGIALIYGGLTFGKVRKEFIGC